MSEDSGTNWEDGLHGLPLPPRRSRAHYGVIGLATDIRLRTPPHPDRRGVDNQALHINALVIGGLQSSLGVYLDEDSMIARLEEIRARAGGQRVTEERADRQHRPASTSCSAPSSGEQIPLFLRWMNDFGTVGRLGAPVRPMTLEQETAWFEAAATAESRYTFTIYERASGRPIGNCGLHEVDLGQPAHRTRHPDRRAGRPGEGLRHRSAAPPASITPLRRSACTA